ncbi:hypothetical protein [Streptomyces sp. NBC_01233]|nr:hypothetical protein OG332_35695 [Streptomyces sp. NBC_01233]
MLLTPMNTLRRHSSKHQAGATPFDAEKMTLLHDPTGTAGR